MATMPDRTELDHEEGIGPVRQPSGLRPWERVATTALSMVILAGGIGVLGRALWRVVHTILGSCELPVDLPTRLEVPGVDQMRLALSAGYSNAHLVLCGVDPRAQLQLATGQLLDAALVSALLITLAALGLRVVMNRSFYSAVIISAVTSGLLIVVAGLASPALKEAALRRIAEQVRADGIETIFPDDVHVPVSWAQPALGLGLVLLALVLLSARRSTRELEGVI